MNKIANTTIYILTVLILLITCTSCSSKKGSQNKDTTPHYHKPSDTYETIDFNYLSSTTNIMYSIIKTLITE